MIHERFFLESPLGGPIRGDLRARDEHSWETAVVVAHGFKGFKDWGFFPYLCERLAMGGHVAISFDFSHNGVRDGEFEDLEAFSRNTFSRELEELTYVLGLASSGELTPAPPSRLGLLGHSRGGGCAILSAFHTSVVDALVTWGAVDHMDRWTQETVREWRDRGVVYIQNQRTGQDLPLSVAFLDDFQANRERLDIRSAAEGIDLPWLVVHGKDDATVPFQEGVTLSDASPKATLVALEGTGHTFDAVHPFAGPTPALEQATAHSLRHFDRYLKGS